MMNMHKKYDIFISYSRKDESIALQLYEYLSTNGVSCWMDKYSIQPGVPYAKAIEAGIKSCDILVLIYSKYVLESTNILSELELAHNEGKRIISFRLDNSPLCNGYGFYLQLPQWIEAYSNAPQQFPNLLSVLKNDSIVFSTKNTSRVKKVKRIIVWIIILLLFIAGLLFIMSTTRSIDIFKLSANNTEQYLDSIRQDSITKALQSEVDRLTKEREKLEHEAKKKEQKLQSDASKSQTAPTHKTPEDKSTPIVVPTPKKEISTTMVHKAIDLGLSVKWASCNIGASKPEDPGKYFAWGEIRSKKVYDSSTYRWCDGSYNSLTKYGADSLYGVVDDKLVLEMADDIAHTNWGGEWRMPTKEEQDELRKKCTWDWDNRNGVTGYIVTSKINGESIFLPAAGSFTDSLHAMNTTGYYWSSSLYVETPNRACGLYMDSTRVGWFYSTRGSGQSVRAVCP